MKLFIFLLSCLLAFIAGHIVNYSIIFLALEWFNSHTYAGIGYALCFGPPLILGWFAGVYCDRFSPRNVILIAQNSFFISLALLYFALSANIETQKVLFIFAGIFTGIAWSFVAPARFTALPFYVNKKKLMFGTIALNLMVMTGFGLAPMILKSILSSFNWQYVFLVAASLFFLSSLLLIPLHISFERKSTEKAIREIKQSIDIIKQSNHLKQFLLLAIIAYLLMGPMQVILPTIAEKTLALSVSSQGNYLSIVAFSLIIGGLFAMWTKSKGKIGLQIMFSIAIAGIGIGYLGQETELVVSVLILGVSAICGGVAISLIVAGLQRYSPNEYRGRIMSIYTIIGQAVPAASGLTSGILAQTYLPKNALLIFSAFIVVCVTLSFISLHSLRKLESFTNA